MELDKSSAMTISTPPCLISVFMIFLNGLAMARIMHNRQMDSMVLGIKLMSRTHLFCSIGAEKDKDILEAFLLLIQEEIRIMTNGKGIKYRK
jgi:predicted neutral ceramidase superfamily lipid hydrolase